MPSFFRRRGGNVSLARAQKLGIRSSRVSAWSRNNLFNYAARVTVIFIAVIVINAFISITIILTKIDFHLKSIQYKNSLPCKNSLPHAPNRAGVEHNICYSREQPNWRDDIDHHFSESLPSEMPTFAVVITVNDGYWDFFVNWHDQFHRRVFNKSVRLLLVIIAEDHEVFKRLKDLLSKVKKSAAIILPGYNITDGLAPVNAEDYDSEAYKSLVSTRATHLLNLLCCLQLEGTGSVAKYGAGPKNETKMEKEKLVIVYSDVDTVWLRDPFPYLESKLFGLKIKNKDIQERQQPNYDILAAVDDHDYHDVDDYYCTGYLVIAQTPASISFLSQWEKELLSNAQLNQPIFNTLLRSSHLPEIRHSGLGEIEFPPGRLYFDEWVKEGRVSEKAMKAKTMVVHNNYIIGHDAKKKRFQKYGLWINKI